MHLLLAVNGCEGFTFSFGDRIEPERLGDWNVDRVLSGFSVSGKASETFDLAPCFSVVVGLAWGVRALPDFVPDRFLGWTKFG